MYQDKKINSAATALEHTTYNTTINEFKSHFKEGLVHDTMMRFVLNTMDIPVDDVINVAPIYPKAVFDYIVNYKVQDKYLVKIFFRKNQSQVLEDQSTLFPENDEIYAWLIRDEEGIYDTDFVLLKLGVHVAQRFKTKELTEDDINTIVKEAIGNAGILHIIEREEIDESVHEALGDALLVAVTLKDLDSNPVFKEVFKADPSAYLLLKTMDFAASTIKDWKLADRHWNPKVANYFPLLSSDRIENAFLCGVINGIIDELAGIADAASFLIKLSKSKTEYENFKTTIRKLLEEENLLELLVKGALKNYIESDSQEKTAYQFGHDLIQIISFIIGIFQFVKSVASFASFVKKAITYLKRFGRKGLDDLKKLNAKDIEKLFTTVDDNIPFDERLRRVEDLFDDLGGRKLNQKDLKLLKQKLKVEYNVDLRLIDKEVGFQKLPAVINGERKLIRSRDLLKDWDRRNVVGKFDEGPPPVMILRSNNASELTVFHEKVHMELWAQKLPKMNIVDEEKLVFDAIFKAKDTHRWTTDELIDSYRYVNEVVEKTNRAGKNFPIIKNEFIEQLIINKQFNIN